MLSYFMLCYGRLRCLVLRISVPSLTQCCSVHLTIKILELKLELTWQVLAITTLFFLLFSSSVLFFSFLPLFFLLSFSPFFCVYAHAYSMREREGERNQEIRGILNIYFVFFLFGSVSLAHYSSTDVSNLYLAKASPKSLHDMIIYNSQTIYPLWNNLVDAVRWVVNVTNMKATAVVGFYPDKNTCLVWNKTCTSCATLILTS